MTVRLIFRHPFFHHRVGSHLLAVLKRTNSERVSFFPPSHFLPLIPTSTRQPFTCCDSESLLPSDDRYNRFTLTLRPRVQRG